MTEVASVRRRSGVSLALDNLRAIVILLVLSFHSAIAYVSFLPRRPAPFLLPPFAWSAFPIIDKARWIGFDLFCAWQDIFLMSLFFFLSGLFVWSSLKRKGPGRFLQDRVLRLGLPFAVVSGLLMPITTYATYLQTGGAPGLAPFWRQLTALPFWPSGPMWFLWLLLVGDIAAAAFFFVAPKAFAKLVEGLSRDGRWGVRLAGLFAASALAYVPLALGLGAMRWSMFGPFSLQLSRPLHYAVYFFAGIAFGARGLERKLFLPDGPLARRWPAWLAAALVTFALWMALAAAALNDHGNAPLALRFFADLSFAAACFANCLCVLAVVLRYLRRPSRVFASLTENAYGMYLVHYLFVVWLQYALLPAALPAILKGLVVFSGTLALSWGTTVALRRLRPAARILGVRHVAASS